MSDTLMLSEHQSARQIDTAGPTDYTPTTEEKKALKLVNKLFDKAKKHRSKYDAKWLDNYKMFRGKQWKENRPSYRHSEVINMVFQHIQSIVPILTDARQRFEYLPEEPSDLEFSKILDQKAESDWQRGNWGFKLTEMLYDSMWTGTGLTCLDHDPEAKKGLGAIRYRSVEPHYCFPDPNSTNVNEGGCFFIEAEPVDIEQLKKEYPDKASFFKSDLIDIMKGSKTDLNNVEYKSPLDINMLMEEGDKGLAKDGDKALKIICWLKSDDYDEEEKRSVDETTQTEKIEYLQKLKYPKGRKIVIAGGVVCEDIPNPFEDGLFPYAKFVNYIDPRTFWGISEIEPLESPQKIFNKLVSFALDVLTLMGNPIWIVDTNSEVDTDNLYNRPGLVVEKAPGSTVTREEGVQLQPYVLQLIDRMKGWFNEEGGSQDITRGIKPDGVTASSAISQLQEAAQTRIRQKSRNLDAYLQDLGQLYVNRVFQFCTAPEIVRLTNDQSASKYFKFSIENKQLPDGSFQKTAKIRNYIENPETGAMTEDPQEKEYQIRGDFDVKVSTGSSLPFAKDQKFSKARQMFLDGVIDEEEYLKAADYPNWQAVLDRVMQKRQEAAQAQAQGGQPAA